jgi:hypothetical protein
MPHGFLTIEQWTTPQDAESRWIPILHLDSHQSLMKAMAALEKRADAAVYLGRNGSGKVARAWFAPFIAGESRSDSENL